MGEPRPPREERWEMAEREHWIRTVPPESLLFMWTPDRETWTPEQRRAASEAVRALALVELAGKPSRHGRLIDLDRVLALLTERDA